MNADPVAFGRAAARVTLAQDARRHLTALPGGSAATPRHVVNLHPSMLPAPTTVELFDREHHDERPVLPLPVVVAIKALGTLFLAPNAHPHSLTDLDRWRQAQNAVLDLTMWREGGAGGVAADADDAPAHGYPRPGASC